MVYEIPSFLITFREGLEAALIIAIILAYLHKVNRKDLLRYAWLGIILAVISSVGIGGTLWVTYRGLSGVAVELFEGGAALTATAVLSYMILWMARNSRRIKGEIEERIDVTISRGQLVGIALIAFIAVVREGIETVLFMTAFFVQDATGTGIGLLLGLLAITLLGALLLNGSVGLPIKEFFKYSSILLLIFAAGLLGFGVHEMVEAAESSGLQLGVVASPAYNINPSSPEHPLHEKGIIGSVLGALVGYDGNPEWLRILAYLGYWIVIGPFIVRTYFPTSTVGRWLLSFRLSMLDMKRRPD